MVHPQAYDGTRRLRRARLRKEERNKWGCLEGGTTGRGKPFMPEIPCKHIPA